MTVEKLTIEESGSAGDNLTASIDHEGSICVEVEEPWSGDTESGFGRSGAIRLTADEALELADWLQRAAAAAVRARSNP